MKKNSAISVPDYQLPELKYTDGDKKMISIRMPEKLWNKLQKLADKKGWDRSALVVAVLDKYAQHEDAK